MKAFLGLGQESRIDRAGSSHLYSASSASLSLVTPTTSMPGI